jgi:type II secretory pathway pseudopilin PulG
VSNLRSVLATMRSQWVASLRLRVGVWLVVAILAAYAIDSGIAYVDARQEELQTADAEVARLRALAAERDWPDRAKEATQLTAALQSMAWSEPNLGLTEAALQDWLRTVSSRLGLKTRELTIVRVEEAAKATAVRADQAKESVGSTSGLAVPAGHVVLRAHMSFELQRAPLVTFLAECARSERSVVVERLVLRQPLLAEVDVRVLARKAQGER